jgi:hypothetical protein
LATIGRRFCPVSSGIRATRTQSASGISPASACGLIPSTDRTVTPSFSPSNESAPPIRPGTRPVPLETSPSCPFPDASCAIRPESSSNLQWATSAAFRSYSALIFSTSARRSPARFSAVEIMSPVSALCWGVSQPRAIVSRI